eukprot:m.606670 g.606670  ORF g.606670 m.606670 type:complete len:276 (-) comp58112_c1_seq59:306-1133(-)
MCQIWLSFHLSPLENILTTPSATGIQGGSTAILKAVEGESIACYQALRAAGADVMARNSFGMTLLHMLAVLGEPTALESLLQEGIFDVNVQDKSGLTALMFAAIWNNMVCVQLLVNAGANPSICDQHGQSALHRAGKGGCYRLLKFLLNACSGADINKQDREGDSPLISALSMFDFSVPQSARHATIKLLLDHGADPLLKNKKWKTAKVMTLQYKCYADLSKLLEEFEDRSTNLGSRTKPAGRAALDLAHPDDSIPSESICWIVRLQIKTPRNCL